MLIDTFLGCAGIARAAALIDMTSPSAYRA